MAVKLWSNRIEQFVDGTGIPRAGAKLFSYVGGSVNTKQTTYTESTGVTPNTNPIVLDSAGRIPQPIWLTTGVSYKFVLAPSTDTDPPTSPIDTLDGITGINDSTTVVNEWIAGPAPTFVSASQFTLVGDQTSTFAKTRRIKATVTAGTVYGTITNTAFAALTTVTVALDSGNLDSGLSAVSYGIVAPVNPSISADEIHRKGTAVASAGTTDIWGIAGDYVHVTGTTGITSFGTAPYAGDRREVIFDGALTITHNATTLQLPGGANITTAAGDRAIVRADTTANMIVVAFEPASVKPLSQTQSANTVLAGPTTGAAAAPTFRALVGAESALVLLSSKTASASASLTFTSSDFDWTAYDDYLFYLVNLITAANDNLVLQVSFDGGASPTWQTAANYVYASGGYTTTGAISATSTGSARIQLMNTLGSSAVAGGVSGWVQLSKPSNASVNKHFVWKVGGFNNTLYQFLDGFGAYTGAQTALLGVKFFGETQNLSSGSIYAYGLRKA